jgi:hypothetical protein
MKNEKSAYPVLDTSQANDINSLTCIDGGMSLCDYFAGQALAGLAVNYLNPQKDNDEAILTLKELVKVSYNIADEMLAEKEKRK